MQSILKSIALVALLATPAALPARADTFAAPTGDVILTLEGALTQHNADGTLQLDQAMLEALPQTSFTTSTSWTSGTPTFQGVLLKDLIAAVGATGKTLTLKAVNDYSITIPMADAGDEAPLLAYLMDGKPMSLRDKGPVWLVYPYDSSEIYRTEEIYARSVWQLVEIEFAE